MYANFNRYDNKGRRLSLFAEEENNKLKIYVITCSKSDQFCKKDGWWYLELHQRYLAGVIQEDDLEELFVPHPQVFEIDVIDNKPKKTFINWCNENFYFLKEKQVRYNRWWVENKNGIRVHVKDSPLCSNKLSKW